MKMLEIFKLTDNNYFSVHRVPRRCKRFTRFTVWEPLILYYFVGIIYLYILTRYRVTNTTLKLLNPRL